MDVSASCASDDADAEKQSANIDSSKRNSESSGRKYVNVLLDLSEEDYCIENNVYLLQSRTGWEDAVEGWARFPSFAAFPQSQRKGKNKQDVIVSHCLLCADLKPSELDSQTPLNPAKETHNTLSSPTSDELYSFSLSLKNMSGPLINKLLSGEELSAQKKSPTVCYYQPESCQLLKEQTVGLSIRSFSVLPPLKESRIFLKSVQPTDWHPAEEDKNMTPRDTSVEGKISAGNDIKTLMDFTPGENSYKCKGALGTKHCLSQDNTQLPSTYNINFQNKYEFHSSALPQFPAPLGRNFRQEELTRSSTRNNTSHRLFSSHKTRDLKRPEAHRLMLIGTRVHMPL
ncbi:uncharacterized protein C16orf46 homolog isoform X1 [Danio rerio]|uniref:Si:ch73-103b9.2 n=2 Tax=Danio rerio TaxID=7955 RepID=A0A8M2B5N6_DANRE|nr:uncharacterized protein LOC100150067 [Danio rerio]XP_005159238.1 uncharacterized protein LOC100150067 isoform X1 [Danio rerio]XP_005159239.1 uncharacterized protein LOC100150067 isoform X1 [Danio rerio]XP_005159240.1 uncharacterized protein LOC100150067 isoform X1 [Danio rerio]|eukprot:NP_001121872.1 uncharacterized protein LOC100150067 [Danio rerio]